MDVLTKRFMPHLIGLCGHPKSGKSEVQKVLNKRFGVIPIDDGEVLRQFCIDYLGLSYDDVYTQEGKARSTNILGRVWQNREILGELGNRLEAMFGESIMPYIATRSLNSDFSYSFGSLRKSQGHFYKNRGGLIIGVRNPLAQPSEYQFDLFDDDIVDFWIDNDAQARGLARDEGLLDLERKVVDAVLHHQGVL